MSEYFYSCGQCGQMGRMWELVAHPTRPMPEDLGFCPHCGGEVDEVLTEDQAKSLLDEYNEEWHSFLASLPGKPA